MNVYMAELITPDGEQCGFVHIYAESEADARGQLMRCGIASYSDLRVVE